MFFYDAWPKYPLLVKINLPMRSLDSDDSLFNSDGCLSNSLHPPALL